MIRKNPTRLLAAASAAVTVSLLAGTFGHAAKVTLFNDNFDTAGRLDDQLFNASASLEADQSGSLATKDYNTVLGGGWAGAYQRGNGGTWLMYAGASGFGSTNMHGSVNNNFATQANLGSALEISFNISVSAPVGGDTSQWSAFAIGGSQNQFVNDAANDFSSLFRDMGGTQQFSDGNDLNPSPTFPNPSPSFTDGQKITFVFSDAAGTGSAFYGDNGANDTVKMYVNGSLTNTFTGLNFDSSEGYISFQANSTVANIDNLNVTSTVKGFTTNTITNELFNNINYDATSIFEWDLGSNKDTDTGTRGTDYDAVSVTGALTISPSAVFKVIQNSGLDFNDTFWDNNQEWSDIFTFGTLNGGWTASTAVSVYDTSGGSVDVSAYGSFTINGTSLTWTAVPEPTSALAGLLLTAGLLRRRRA